MLPWQLDLSLFPSSNMKCKSARSLKNIISFLVFWVSSVLVYSIEPNNGTAVPSNKVSDEVYTDLMLKAKDANEAHNIRRKDRDLQKKEATEFVEKTYDSVLETLDVSVDKKAEVLRLLVKLHQERLDVVNMIVDGKISEKNAEEDAIKKTKNNVNESLRVILDTGRVEQVMLMIEAQYYLSEVENNEAKLCSDTGNALNPKQRLALALAMYKYFDPYVNPLASKLYHLPLNTNGLTNLEEEFFASLEGQLTMEQRFIIRNRLVTNQRVARRVHESK